MKQRLQAQIPVMERLGRLKQFLTPTLAELVVSTEGAALLQRQQRTVTVVCCTLQGFDAFVATATLAQVLAALTAYDTAVGPAIRQGEGLVEQQTDGSLRVVFNAPLSCADHAGQAVHMAMALRDQLAPVYTHWRAQQYALELGLGIAQGEATLGLRCGAGRLDYAVLGPVMGVATALSEAAADGQILLCPAGGSPSP